MVQVMDKGQVGKGSTVIKDRKAVPHFYFC